MILSVPCSCLFLTGWCPVSWNFTFLSQFPVHYRLLSSKQSSFSVRCCYTPSIVIGHHYICSRTLSHALACYRALSHTITHTLSHAVIPHATAHYHTQSRLSTHAYYWTNTPSFYTLSLTITRTFSHAVIPHSVARYHTQSFHTLLPSITRYRSSFVRQPLRRRRRRRRRLRITAGLEARVSVTSAAFSSAERVISYQFICKSSAWQIRQDAEGRERPVRSSPFPLFFLAFFLSFS